MTKEEKCKFCGKPVRCKTAHHAACWEGEVEQIAASFCDNYCRWPHVCSDEDELQEKHCDDCVIVRLLNVGL